MRRCVYDGWGCAIHVAAGECSAEQTVWARLVRAVHCEADVPHSWSQVLPMRAGMADTPIVCLEPEEVWILLILSP